MIKQLIFGISLISIYFNKNNRLCQKISEFIIKGKLSAAKFCSDEVVSIRLIMVQNRGRDIEMPKIAVICRFE